MEDKSLPSPSVHFPRNDHILFEACPGLRVALLPDEPKFTIIALTNEYLSETGLLREEATGKGLFELFPPDQVNPSFTGENNLSASLRRVIQFKEPDDVALQRYDIPDGRGGFKERYWKARNVPVLDASGNLISIIHTAENVTAEVLADPDEIAKAERRAEESEERFRTMANSIPQLAWITDKKGFIRWYNQRWYDYTGSTPEEMLGWGWKKVHHPAMVDKVVQKFSEAIEKQQSWEDTFLLRSKSGEYRWFLSRSVPVRKNGELIGWFGTNTDITVQRQIEDTLKQSEKKLRDLILNAPVAMCIGDGPSFTVEIANERMLEIWGVAAEEIIGKPVFEVLTEAGEQGFKEIIGQVFITRERYTANESPVPLPRNGRTETVYVNFIYEPVKDEHGNVQKIIAVANDVTELVTARKKIEETNREFRFVMDFVPQIIWVTYADGYHYYYNKQWYEYTGIPFNEAEGDGWNNVFHPDDQQRSRELWSHSLKTGEPYEMEFRLRRHDGQYRWFLARAFPLKDEEGKIQKWFGTSTDVHEQKTSAKTLEELVRERTSKLNRSNEDLQQFVHVSSHDLKEPVRKIELFSRLILEKSHECLDERNLYYIERISLAANRMRHMLEGVLAYATAGEVAVLYEKVDLNEVLKNVLLDLELVIQEKHAIINADMLPKIEAVKEMMHQLLYNIIGNSLKFGRERTVPEIRISSAIIKKQEKQLVHITVADNGIGFDMKDAEQIFGTFTRLNPKDNFEGAGLGLSLCKKIVQRHGGVIKASGGENNGARIDIELPLTRPAS